MMKSYGSVPAGVLSEEFARVLDRRRVVAGVFTTFSFDPAFFELNILPLLFDQSFHQADKVRLLQLEDALRELEDLSVYYDRSALSQDAVPPQLDYRRNDVHRRDKGVFHPKVILLLVENEVEGEDETCESLIVGILSANITRAGWWENVECAHFEEIDDKEIDDTRCPFRTDLLSLVKGIRATGAAEDDHSALDRVHRFLLKRVTKKPLANASVRGRFYTRVFCGQKKLDVASWLAQLRLGRIDWNLEVISPFFDAHGLGVLERLIEAVGPKKTRVYLPRDPNGVAEVTEKTFRAMNDIPNADWATLSGPITSRSGGDKGSKRLPRRVHAKVYRLWTKSGPDLWLLGSVNLTSAGHSHVGAGNLEAAYLFDASAQGGARRWWLRHSDDEVTAFQEPNLEETDGFDEAPIQISLRYDWASGELCYRADTADSSGFSIHDPTGKLMATVSRAKQDAWVKLGVEESARVRDALISTSFLVLRKADTSWRILVREENMGHRPSRLKQLSPEEILEYWALLSPEQRAAFIELHLAGDADLQGIPLARSALHKTRNSLFDRFAGIFHAFGCLRRHSLDALKNGRIREAEARILGAKYDSLPALLEKTLDNEDGDPVSRYVTLLCARELRHELGQGHPHLFKAHPSRTAAIDDLLERGNAIRDAIQLDGDAQEFLEWYESAFASTGGSS